MDPPLPPSVLVSFSGTDETRVCGREPCQRTYSSCNEEEKRRWKFVSNSRNTDGDATRWLCGTCMAYYSNKGTTHRRGAKAKLIVSS